MATSDERAALVDALATEIVDAESAINDGNPVLLARRVVAWFEAAGWGPRPEPTPDRAALAERVAEAIRGSVYVNRTVELDEIMDVPLAVSLALEAAGWGPRPEPITVPPDVRAAMLSVLAFAAGQSWDVHPTAGDRIRESVERCTAWMDETAALPERHRRLVLGE